MFTFYVLQSLSSQKIYIGQTNNIERRIIQHNFRTRRYTSGKGPWQIIYKEEFETRSEAMKREKNLKSGKGREFIKSIINNKMAEQSA